MSRMTERPDLFARRNRLRILGLLALATVVYWLAVCAVAVGTALVIVFWVIGNAGFPDSVDLLKWFGIGVAVLVGLSIVVGTFLALGGGAFLGPPLRRGTPSRACPPPQTSRSPASPSSRTRRRTRSGWAPVPRRRSSGSPPG